MSASDDYCELCDLPKSQCVHGRPPAPEPVKAPPKPKPRKTATASRTTTTTRTAPVSRRWTPPDALKPLIVTVLEDAGGELEADQVFRELETRLEDRLLPGDRETTPEGELRWRYAARRARQALISEGLMTKGTPGVWTLA
ncbi:hypothetical protein AB3X52_05905 [Nocardioides sp. DS6]|uniref:Restriction system protein Mrr-like N-terminal domain-containing protein n=1 Tax=Nocardioides eburneus TaxID=3231482 RepID=A0ABV3SW35_9ACTN